MAFNHSSDDRDAVRVKSSEKVELIWQMGMASLNETDNELRLPTTVSGSLTHEEIKLLESRLSEHLDNTPVVSFQDLSMNLFRILRMPEMQKAAQSPMTPMSPDLLCSPISSSSPGGKDSMPKNRQYGKKSKIPRPPNAFILYRQKHHPLLKQENADLHNNEISVILGHQWKTESTAVRNEYKKIADELKRQHLIKFPGYQYAPRKPSEKKRRMTARKLANAQSSAAAQDVSDFPTFGTFGDDQDTFHNSFNVHDASQHPSLQHDSLIDEILGIGVEQAIPTLTFSSNSNGETFNQLESTSSGLPNTAQNNLSTSATETVTPPVFSADNIPFLNSVIDWEAIQETMDLFEASIAEDALEVQQMQNDHPYMAATTEDERTAFDAELERTLDLFE